MVNKSSNIEFELIIYTYYKNTNLQIEFLDQQYLMTTFTNMGS